MVTGSISEQRILISMEPPILEWLTHEARIFGVTVPAIARNKLRRVWEDLPRDWKEQLKK